jgi:PAS domain S-box-containing protein
MGAAASLTVSHRNALRLLKLVNTMLDFSRIEAGRIKACYQAVDIEAVTTELASNFRSLCEKAGLQLIVDCAPLVPPEAVYLDRDMWEKIVLNLISNAFKFTLQGQIEVQLRVVDGKVVLTVRDTGVGIPMDELPRMFERFHRVEHAQGRTHEGTGIGLALVQELVKLHGGTVEVASVLGEGSLFTVALPLGTAHLDRTLIGKVAQLESTSTTPAAFVEEALRWLPDEPSAKDRDFETGRQTFPDVKTASVADQNGRASILWADDNADMRAYVSRLLGDRFSVTAVADGQAALDAARVHRPDLVLADIMMPKLDGFGLLQALRADAQLRDIPIILLSARAGEEARIEGMYAGADDYLIKPFSARELVARVESHVKMARTRKQALETIRHSENALKHSQIQLSEKVMEFETLFREAPIGFAVSYDTGCQRVRMNDALARLLGSSAKEGATRTRECEALFSFRALKNGHELAAKDLPMQRAAREHREIHNFEFEVAREDGISTFLSCSAVPLIALNGDPVGVIGVFLDVTERTHAGLQGATLLAELERSNADLSRFSYAVSHDLQAPVRSVRALTELLVKRNSASQEDTAHLATLIEQAAEGMERLIDSLLRYAQAGQGELNRQSVSAEAAIDAVRVSLGSLIAKTGARISTTGLPAVDADPVQLQQLFQNLIANGIKYHRQGEVPIIEIHSETVAEGWRFSVKDNGEGILPKHQDLIFEALKRLHGSNTPGSGLGLALCKTIVARHGGRIWVESEGAGHGATFFFTLAAAGQESRTIGHAGSA